jgi:hypothetical protein
MRRRSGMILLSGKVPLCPPLTLQRQIRKMRLSFGEWRWAIRITYKLSTTSKFGYNISQHSTPFRFATPYTLIKKIVGKWCLDMLLLMMAPKVLAMPGLRPSKLSRMKIGWVNLMEKRSSSLAVRQVLGLKPLEPFIKRVLHYTFPPEMLTKFDRRCQSFRRARGFTSAT